MIVIHAVEDGTTEKLSIDIHTVLEAGETVVFAGFLGEFNKIALPDAEGRLGGPILRVTYLQPRISAFNVLADCARLFGQLLAEHPGSLRYLRTSGCLLPEVRTELEPPHVTWITGSDGEVTAFRLAPLVLGSPFLGTLTSRLATCSMPDERRFAFLAAAFEGI